MKVMGVGWCSNVNDIETKLRSSHFLNIKVKRTWLIPKILKIEAKQTLLIQELAKIEAKRPLLISDIRKIQAKQTPELGTRSFFRSSLSAPHSIFSSGSLTLMRSFFEFPYSLVAQTLVAQPVDR
jgi:hypothetical protein